MLATVVGRRWLVVINRVYMSFRFFARDGRLSFSRPFVGSPATSSQLLPAASGARFRTVRVFSVNRLSVRLLRIGGVNSDGMFDLRQFQEKMRLN